MWLYTQKVNVQIQIQVVWKIGHNLTIGGREFQYSGSNLKGIVTDVQVAESLFVLMNYLW